MCVITHVWAESQEFMLILAISIWHHSIHSSFLPSHIFNSLLRQWKICHLLSLIRITPLICNHCQHQPLPHPAASLKFWLCHPAPGLSLWCDVLSSLCWRLVPGNTPGPRGHSWLDSDPSRWASPRVCSPHSTQNVCSATTCQAAPGSHTLLTPRRFWFSVSDRPPKCVPSSPCLAFSSLFRPSSAHLYPEAGMANLFSWFSHQIVQQRRGKKEKRV